MTKVPFPVPENGRWVATLEVYFDATIDQYVLRLIDAPKYIIDQHPSSSEMLEKLAESLEAKNAIQSLRDQARKLS